MLTLVITVLNSYHHYVVTKFKVLLNILNKTSLYKNSDIYILLNKINTNPITSYTCTDVVKIPLLTT